MTTSSRLALASLVLAFGFIAVAFPITASAQSGSSLGGSGSTNTTTGSSLGGSGNTNPPANGGSGSNTILVNPLGAGTSLPTLLSDILSIIVRLGSVVVILMLVYIGFLFVTAQGNESKLSQAKQALMWTIVGALILLGAQAIASGIQSTVSAISG